jgi:hypothetical protein
VGAQEAGSSISQSTTHLTDRTTPFLVFLRAQKTFAEPTACVACKFGSRPRTWKKPMLMSVSAYELNVAVFASLKLRSFAHCLTARMSGRAAGSRTQ